MAISEKITFRPSSSDEAHHIPSHSCRNSFARIGLSSLCSLTAKQKLLQSDFSRIKKTVSNHFRFELSNRFHYSSTHSAHNQDMKDLLQLVFSFSKKLLFCFGKTAALSGATHRVINLRKKRAEIRG